MGRSRTLTRSVLVGGSLLAMALLGEGWVRTCTNFRYTAPRIFRPSPIIPWELTPHAHDRYDGYWKEFRVSLDINSLGYRDEEFTPAKPAGVFRILVVGDSFTFGYGVEQPQAYPEALERLLNERNERSGMRYEVINAGYAGGYAPDTEFVYFRHRGRLLAPDLVVLGYFEGNDLNDLLYTRWPDVDAQGWPLRVTTGLYYIDTAGRLRTARGVGTSQSGDAGAASWLAGMRLCLRDHSQLLNFLVQQYRLMLVTHGSRSTNFDALPAPGPDDVARAREKAEMVLAGFASVAAEAGSRFAIVQIPPKGGGHGIADEPKWLARWCARHHVPLIETQQALLPAQQQALYFPIDPHWNRQGHAAAAAAIYHGLRRERLIP